MSGQLDGLNFNGEIFYASPSADNLYFGQTVWRTSYSIYNPNENKTHSSGWNSFGNVPFDCLTYTDWF